MLAAEKVIITTLVENYVDMLIPDTQNVKRPGLAYHFDPRNMKIQAENGLAVLVDVYFGAKRYRILLDTGLTADILLHNMKALGISPNEIDHVVISHGHPDHYGGLLGLLKARDYPLVITLHPDAFLVRHVKAGSGMVIPYYNQSLRREEIEAAGGRLVLTKDPVPVCPAATTTGEIPLKVPFEPPGPVAGTPSSLWCVRDGRFEEDPTLDDIALAVHMKDKGLLVITGCAHAGVINSIRQAQKVTGIDKLHALLGGFHLGFPGIPEEKGVSTINELKALNPSIVSPMHCSGFRTLAAVQREMPEAFLLNTAGAQITF
jgi:7,8-dihydropterin-6-yl-methyl-4-(beta-D-ribofuranosyl)aminobenzene 5'-phosphate synthase